MSYDNLSDKLSSVVSRQTLLSMLFISLLFKHSLRYLQNIHFNTFNLQTFSHFLIPLSIFIYRISFGGYIKVSVLIVDQSHRDRVKTVMSNEIPNKRLMTVRINLDEIHFILMPFNKLYQSYIKNLFY